MVYWLRMSRATWCAILSTSASVLGEEDLAAGGLGQRLQRALRALRFAPLFLAEQADRRRSGLRSAAPLSPDFPG